MRKITNSIISATIVATLTLTACSNEKEKEVVKSEEKKPELTKEEKFKKELIGKFDAGYGTLEFREDGTLKRETLGQKDILKYEIDGFNQDYAVVDFIESNKKISTFYLKFDENKDLLKTYRIGENEDTFKRQ